MSTTCPVSVIISCSNAATYLPATVESVFAQRLIGVEILIIDNCSTDTSAAVAAALARQHPQVQVFRQSASAGPAAARNRGLQLATGQYVCFLDARDIYAPFFFRNVLPMFQTRPELAAVSTGIELINCHRQVHAVQLRSVTNSLSSNLLVRRNVANFLGGFSEDVAFRGPAAGDDAAFRQALVRYFQTERCKEPYLRHLIQPGSHFDRFLDRSEVLGGGLRIVHHTEEERSGALKAAVLAYQERVETRIAALNCARTEPARAEPI